MQEYVTVVGNTKPLIGIQVIRDGAAIDLVEAGVDLADIHLIIKDPLLCEQTNTGHTDAGIESAVNGLIYYEPEAVDFPLEGIYMCDVILNYNDGGVETLSEQLMVVARA